MHHELIVNQNHLCLDKFCLNPGDTFVLIAPDSNFIVYVRIGRTLTFSGYPYIKHLKIGTVYLIISMDTLTIDKVQRLYTLLSGELTTFDSDSYGIPL